MRRSSLLVKKNLAVIRLGLVSIFFITCVLVPAMKLLPFFEWTIIHISERYLDKQSTTRVYFDGITRYTTYSGEIYADTIHEYSFKELKTDARIYGIYPKLFGDYLEILSLSGMGMILLGTIIFGLKLGLNYHLWKSEKQINSLIYHGSSIVAVLVILIYWTLLSLTFVGTHPVPAGVSSTNHFILPPTPNLVLVFMMIIGIVSLFGSDNFESILTRLKRT